MNYAKVRPIKHRQPRVDIVAQWIRGAVRGPVGRLVAAQPAEDAEPTNRAARRAAAKAGRRKKSKR